MTSAYIRRSASSVFRTRFLLRVIIFARLRGKTRAYMLARCCFRRKAYQQSVKLLVLLRESCAATHDQDPVYTGSRPLAGFQVLAPREDECFMLNLMPTTTWQVVDLKPAQALLNAP